VQNCQFQESHAVEKWHGGHHTGGTGNEGRALANFMNQTFTNLS